MPEFEVILLREVTENMSVIVTAKNADTAEKGVEAQMSKLQHDKDKIAQFYKTEWEVDTEEISIDNVDEV